MLQTLSTWIAYIARITPYRDLIEILLFSVATYHILIWLRKDSERNLLGPLYIYCAFIFTAHYADLQVVRYVLFLSMPLVAVLFVILHQETLQKNFVKLTKSTASALETSHWVDELIKCCLTALNRHKEIILVIERNDHLKNLIHAPYFIYAELKRDVFDILLEKHAAGDDFMIWINQQGKLVSINSTWRTNLDEAWISKEAEHMHIWKQQALYITAKTDAIVFKVTPLSRSFDLITQGKIIEGINVEQAATFLRKNLLAPRDKTKPAAPQRTDTSPHKEQTLS